MNRIIKLIFRIMNTILGKTKRFILKLKSIWSSFFMYRTTTIQIIITLSIFAVYEFIFVMYTFVNEDSIGFIFMFLGFLALSYFIIRLGSDLNRMLYTTEKISNGNINTTINPDAVIIPMKKLANQINCIGTGLTAAVEGKIKSERLKAELITNVSHDIKTPLTSIITYIDLLEKEKLNNEKAYEYLAILKEKSWRLKTLIEDLVDASKASTGNINLNIEKINLSELLKQSCGEFEDRFHDKKLDIILNLPEESVFLSADGRSTYRIIENLFSNVTKYTLESTRVYIDVYVEDSYASLIIKNISAARLNISSDELLERFVRGDASRNTEGNGLGISIANSLTDLLKGSLELSVDGDLFKVIVKLPLYTESALPDLSINFNKSEI